MLVLGDPPFIKERFEFSKFFQKGGVQKFPIKREVLAKQGAGGQGCIIMVFLKKSCSSPVESNQQMCDLWKWVFFEKQRHCGPL